jgi:predicted nucleotidyltransferase
LRSTLILFLSLTFLPVYAAADGLTAFGNQLWYQDVADVEGIAWHNDMFGWAVAAGDFNGDGFVDLAVGAPNDSIGGVADAGAVNVFYGGVGGLGAVGDQLWHQDTAGIVDNADGDDSFGRALACGDFNGDTYVDLAIGVPTEDYLGVADCGVVHVLYGSSTGLDTTGSQLWVQSYDGLGGGSEAGDQFGYSLTSGDFNGDGYADLAVGVPYEDVSSYTNTGVAFVIYGGSSGLDATGSQIWYQNASYIVDECEANDRFGHALGAGDLNGDGWDELVVGVIGENDSSGVVHTISGGPGGLGAAFNQLWGQGLDGIADASEPGDEFGFAVAVGNFNGDAYMDVAVGAPGEDRSGAIDCGVVNVIYGSAARLDSTGNQVWVQGGAGVQGVAESGDMFGCAVACGDFDDDGYADLAAGARGEAVGANDSAGAVNVLYGGSAGLSATGNQVWHQNTPYIEGGCEPGDFYGHSLACGDFDDDGFADLAVGIPGEDVAGMTDAGAVSVLNHIDLFMDIGAGLPGVIYSSAAWGDYDNDGDLDILLTGSTGSADISRIYRNDGGSFIDIGDILVGVSRGSVAWGDYDNDGDLDILIAGYDTEWGPVTIVYDNFEGDYFDIDEQSEFLAQVDVGSVAWGDYDNDGDLDILLTGDTGSAAISRIYRNDGGVFTDIVAGLRGVDDSSVAWGDYDNDGDLDILLTGYALPEAISCLYRNDGGVFTDIVAGLRGVYDSSVAWGDYDNDGDLDILLTGDTGSGGISRVYRNDGGVFTDIVADLGASGRGSVAWGDYDNDGDLDILLTGNTGSRVHRNDGGSFVDIGAGLPYVSSGSVAWGDYDNDGDLDILITGGGISRVYRNTVVQANTPPAAPTNPNATVDGSEVTFSWDAATDTGTPSLGLTYNLRAGTTPGGWDLCVAMADAGTGYRRIPALGNTNHNTSWTITVPDPLPATIYWSVQAIDACFAGSAFAAEEVYDVPTGVSGNALPTSFALRNNIPNPFNPNTTIRYDLPESAPVSLRIYDVAGRLVKTLRGGGVEPPGFHKVVWSGRDNAGQRVASGVYFYRLDAGEYSETKKMVLIK